ncbi:MAG: transcription antitermination factor NusB [Bacilli bacterium]|nr:transcription antitermination factor NusB [Bacilli bacterium]MDD4077569.1 transcription antitermination factor NusB [Bacilli bacterium]
MKRNNSRIKAMMVLYHYDLMNEKTDINYFNKIINEDEEVLSDEEFFDELVEGVIEHLEEINRIINLNIKNWTLDRMSVVDRALIRIGVYEMLYTDTPKNIIINEIINLTHEYSDLGDKNAARFNNRLLDEIRKNIDGE